VRLRLPDAARRVPEPPSAHPDRPDGYTSDGQPISEPPPGGETWRTVRQFAQAEGVSRSTVWRWISRGLLDVHRVGPGKGLRVRRRARSAPKLAYPGRRTKIVVNAYGEVFTVPLD
jgi:hypothetical protein